MKYSIDDYVLIRKFNLLYPAKITGFLVSDSYYLESRYFNGDIITHSTDILDVLTQEEYFMTPSEIRETFPEEFI